MGKYLDMARKFVDDQEGVALVEPVDFTEMPPTQPKQEVLKFSLFDHLTPAEKEAFHEYVDLMTSEKFKMPLAEAEQEAAKLVARSKQVLQLPQAVKGYKRYGYIKIWSTVLDEAVYLAKDEKTGKRVPDQRLPVFTEDDLKELDAKTLTPQEAKLIMSTKSVFGGSIKTGMVPEFIQNDSTNKTNLTKKVLADGGIKSVGKR